MPPLRRMTMEEVAAWLDLARARDLERRAAAPPTAVTADRDVKVSQVKPGEQVTIPDRAYDLLWVQAVTQLDESTYQLRVTSPRLQEPEDITLPADTVVTVHGEEPLNLPDASDRDGTFGKAANGGIVGPEPDTQRDAAVVTVLGPPPLLNRTPYPYQGTIDFQGLPILVENPRGTERRGIGHDGKPWAITMLAHYGEIANTVGADGDPVDVYVGEDATAPDVWVMQTKVPGSDEFDEVKAFLGFRTRDDALRMFRAHYDRPGFLFGIAKWAIDDFKAAMVLRSTSSGRLDAPGDQP